MIESKKDDVSIDDVLKSIKGIIDDTNNKNDESKDTDTTDTETLELTEIVSESSDQMDSNRISSKGSAETQALNLMIPLLRPMIKDWIDNNLPDIAGKIISEELKNILNKKK